MARLVISLFGAFSVTLDGQPITSFTYDKVRALLAYLVVEKDRAHRREQLCGLLWPDTAPALARQNLSQALHALRRSLGTAHDAYILASRHEIRFNPHSDHELDVAAFCTLAAAPDDTPSALDAWAQANACYKGEFLAGFSLRDAAPFEEWVLLQRELLQRMALQTLRYLVAGWRRRGAAEEALKYAWRLVELEPWDEEAHCQIMQLLAACGRTSEALAQYERCRDILARELDIAPQPETTALYHAIRQREPTGPTGDELASSGGTSPRPTLGPPLIGREHELAQVAQRLADPACRLLTLLGPGGVGKSRLARQVMTEHAHSYADGACWVALTAVEPTLFLVTLMQTLHVPMCGSAAPKAQLLAFLATKNMLLVLDNFEHLVTEAELIGEIVAACPSINVLVTTRVRLALDAEWLISLDGLVVPPALANSGISPPEGVVTAEPAPMPDSFGAVQLFIHAVRRTLPDFSLNAENASQVVRICQLLDGIPLALELAAGWVRFLPLSEICAKLEQSLDLLQTTLRDIAPRHRSMRAVFDHSWHLLTAHEQTILCALAVFRDGCTVEAAAAVAGADLVDLVGLVDKTWLHAAGNGRYALHELVRQYAEEQLLEQQKAIVDDVRRRHCLYYTQLLRAQHGAINIRKTVMGEIMRDYGNFLAAWSWAVEHGELAAARDMVFGLWFASDMLGAGQYTLQLFAQAIEQLASYARPDHPNQAEWEAAGAVVGWLMRARTDFLIQRGMLDQALAEAERHAALAQSLPPGHTRAEHMLMSSHTRALITDEAGDFTAARGQFRALLQRFRTEVVDYSLYGLETGAIFWQAHCEAALSYFAYALGRYPVAKLRLERTLALRRRIGEQRFGASNLGILVDVELAMGNIDAASAAARQRLWQSSEFGDEVGIAKAHQSLGLVEVALGHLASAQGHYRQAEAVARQSGHHALLMASLTGLGRVALALGHLEDAQTCFTAAVDEFVALPVQHSSSLAAALLGLGWTALARGNVTAAQQHFRQVPSTQGCLAWVAWDAFVGLAEVCAQRGDLDQTVAYYDLVLHGRGAAHATQQRVLQRIDQLALPLPAAGKGWRRVVPVTQLYRLEDCARLAGSEPLGRAAWRNVER